MTFSLHHLGLTVPNLDAAVSFYQDILGFTLGRYNELSRNGEVRRIQFMDLDDLSLELIEKIDASTEGTPSMHIAFTPSDFDAAIAAMVEAGCPMDGDGLRGESPKRIVFFTGPSGERLELSERR